MKKLPNDWEKVFVTNLSKYPKNSYYPTLRKILALCKCSVGGNKFEKEHKERGQLPLFCLPPPKESNMEKAWQILTFIIF